MGKIGDLFVRLGLKSDGFKKGMQDAKKETQGFGNTLKNMKAGAVASMVIVSFALFLRNQARASALRTRLLVVLFLRNSSTQSKLVSSRLWKLVS